MNPPQSTVLPEAPLYDEPRLTDKDPVSNVTKDRISVRDVPIQSLIGERSFTSSIFLLFEGRLPDECEETMVQAVLVALVDHGHITPATEASLAVLAGGNPLHVSVGAGVLAFGATYGGAIDEAARVFTEAVQRPGAPSAVAKEIVGLHAGRRQSIPGYGHDLHDTDPRTVALMLKARELGVYGRHCAIAEAVEKVLSDRYNESYPLNVGGAAAAIICELGCDWRMARALYILSRTAGTIAHVLHSIREPKMDEPVGFGGSHSEP